MMQAKPHEGAAMTGELRERLPAPAEGFLKCCRCGCEQRFLSHLTYEEQAACFDPECTGQMFCNKWSGWQ